MKISGLAKTVLHNLKLENFRNYNSLFFEPDPGITLIYGVNGIGKTNIIEAVSLLVPGRGIRNDKIADIDNIHTKLPWKITSSVSGSFGKSEIKLSHNYDHKVKISKKEVIIDGLSVRGQNKILENISVSWLVPQMDQIFLENNIHRRKFFDRIIGNFSKNHNSMLAKYDYLVKERLNILKIRNHDIKWLEIIERKIAETSVVIAEARKNFCEYINEIIWRSEYSLPKAYIAFEGMIEKKLGKYSALQLEDEICDLLREYRNIDKENGRSNTGIHRSDLVVYYREKNISAKYCSTGEQKSLLISLFLGEIFAHIKWYNRIPILLLDDIMSHLDTKKREMLFEIISHLGAQVIITAVDADSNKLISNIPLEMVTIENGKLIK